MNTSLFRLPPSAKGRGAGVSLKTITLVALLGVTAALAGIYQEPDAEPPAQPLAPAVENEQVLPNPDFAALTKMHERASLDFESKPGFGRSRSAFMPYMTDLVLGGSPYVVRRPDLIGIEASPIVYLSPSQNETIKITQLTKGASRSLIKTRAHTTAEAAAVAELRMGKEIVLQPARVPTGARFFAKADGYRAVGALRANSNCAKCHGCAEGTLLGAFSYTMIPKAAYPTYSRKR